MREAGFSEEVNLGSSFEGLVLRVWCLGPRV